MYWNIVNFFFSCQINTTHTKLTRALRCVKNWRGKKKNLNYFAIYFFSFTFCLNEKIHTFWVFDFILWNSIRFIFIQKKNFYRSLICYWITTPEKKLSEREKEQMKRNNTRRIYVSIEKILRIENLQNKSSVHKLQKIGWCFRNACKSHMIIYINNIQLSEWKRVWFFGSFQIKVKYTYQFFSSQ